MFTASPSMTLVSNRTYSVLIRSPGRESLSLDLTTANGEDTGSAAGWLLADNHHFKNVFDEWGITGSGNSFRIRIKGTIVTPNSVPTVANEIPDQSATAGTAFSYQFPTTTFSDADSDTLTYAATKADDSALPTWLTFTATTRTFSGTPQTADIGTVSVKVTVSDGSGGSVSDTFDIVVNATTNSAPTVTNEIPDQSATVGTTFSYQFPTTTFSDADSDTLTYAATKADDSALPTWLTFTATTRTFSGTPQTADIGTVSVKVTVSDGSGGSVSDEFNITSSSLPTFSVEPDYFLAIEEHIGEAVLTISLDGPAESDLRIRWFTGDAEYDTAEAPDDYAARRETLLFAAGDTRKTISVPIVDDAQREDPVDGAYERFTIFIESDENYRWNGWSGSRPFITVEILDNDEDAPPGGGSGGDGGGTDPSGGGGGPTAGAPGASESRLEAELFSPAAVVTEGRPLVIRVRRSGGLAYAAYGYIGVTDSAVPEVTVAAVGRSDGLGRSRLEFATGATEAMVTVIPAFDGKRGAGRVITATLESVDVEIGGAVLAYELVTAALAFPVTDADAVLSVSDARADAESAALVFRVRLDRPRDVPVRVDYATEDGTARAGEDYTAVSGTLEIAAGGREATVTVPLLTASHLTGERTLVLRLSNARNARLENGMATGTIRHSDPVLQAWLSRFGRTVGTHVVDAVGTRLRGAPGVESHVTVGGYRLPLKQTPAGEPAATTPRGGE